MLEVYNHYLGGYLPKVSPRTNVHRKSELKSIYKDIRTLNEKSPMALIRMSDDKQAYALDVKEMSMELYASAEETLMSQMNGEENEDALDKTVETFNKLIKRSDEFGQLNNKPSRPGGELRNLVEEFSQELEEAGIVVNEDSTLTIANARRAKAPTDFLTSLVYKSKSMSMNPLEYVDKKIYSYAFLSNRARPSTYNESVYSGMLFNSYC